ncbi:MAG: hypothetical protein H0X36_01590, partial [Sphingomonadaceae bacterium]|nr:hypothetical protein [Sphingomonadaceae bacterium]
MRSLDPFHGLSRAQRREVEALPADDPDRWDDDQITDLLLVEAPDLDASIDCKLLVKHAFARLSERQERILRLRYGFAGVGCHTYREVGAELGVTVERARQIEQGEQRKIVRRFKHRKLLTCAELQRLEAKHHEPHMRRDSDPPSLPSPLVYAQLGQILQPPLPIDSNLVDPTAKPPNARPIEHVDAPAPAQRPWAPLWSLLTRLWN